MQLQLATATTSNPNAQRRLGMTRQTTYVRCEHWNLDAAATFADLAWPGDNRLETADVGRPLCKLSSSAAIFEEFCGRV